MRGCLAVTASALTLCRKPIPFPFSQNGTGAAFPVPAARTRQTGALRTRAIAGYSGRQGEWPDFWADTSGTLLGIEIGRRLRQIYRDQVGVQ